MLTIKILFTINSLKNYSVKTLFTIPFVQKITWSVWLEKNMNHLIRNIFRIKNMTFRLKQSISIKKIINNNNNNCKSFVRKKLETIHIFYLFSLKPLLSHHIRIWDQWMLCSFDLLTERIISPSDNPVESVPFSFCLPNTENSDEYSMKFSN